MTEEAGSSNPEDIHPKEQGWAAFFDDVFGVQWPSGEWEPEEADFAEWDKHARHKSAEWHGPEAKYAQNPVIYSHPVAAVVTRRLWAPAHVLFLTSVDN